jgi:long-chain fatty acid transport protein
LIFPEVDADYVRWQSIRDFDVHLSTGVTIPNPQKWSNAITAAIGTEYKWLQLEGLPAWELALRGGYIRSPSPIPDQNFNPAVADSPNHVLSAGIGFLCKQNGHFLGVIACGEPGDGAFRKKAIGLDLAYSAFLFEPRTVMGHPNPTVDGTYKTTTHVGAITVRVNF